MKYIYKQRWSEDIEFDNVDEVTEHVIETVDFHDEYDELLDECWGEISIGDMYYYASNVLKKVDPIAYDCGYSDYTDSLYRDIKDRLENLNDGEIEHFNMNTIVIAIWDEEKCS